MRHLIWLLALPAAAVEIRFRWVSFPLSQQLPGGQFPFGAYDPAHVHSRLLSYGVVAAVLTSLAALAFALARPRLLGWLGSALLLVGISGLLKVAYTDGLLLTQLTGEFDQQQSAAAFAQAALPPNAGAEPSVWSRLSVETLTDRAVASFYFTRLACWTSLFCGGLALSLALLQVPRLGWVLPIGLALLTAVSTAGARRGEQLMERAVNAESSGDAVAAAQLYRAAMASDSWLANQLDPYQRLGNIDASLGHTGTVEYWIYHAELPSTQVDISRSVAELAAQIPRTAEPLSGLLGRSIGQFLTQTARSLHGTGAHGAAATACETALRYDPAAILPAYYLSREYYLIGAYSRAIAFTQQTLERTGDPTVRADLFSNIGDAQSELGAMEQAKTAYRESYVYDYLLNLRALSALDGP